MPICLTGDVHHTSLGTADQADLKGSEPRKAVEYAEIVEEYGLEATLFVTGRTADEDPQRIRELGELDCIEVGGHNYGAFTIPSVPKSGKFFKGYRFLTGNNCPRWLQYRGIKKTLARLKAETGEEVISWRDHAFNRDGNTYDLLAATNVRYVSDVRSPHHEAPYTVQTSNGPITEVPINVPPDHDHIQHAEVSSTAGWSDPFSGTVYSGEEWLQEVHDCLNRFDPQDDTVTILAHPACMSLIDDFELFEQLCHTLSKYETVQMQDLAR